MLANTFFKRSIFIYFIIMMSCCDISSNEVEQKVTNNTIDKKKNTLAGIVLSKEIKVSFHNGIIKNNPIGINISSQKENYDMLDKLQSLYFENNQNNFDSQEIGLSLPEFEVFSHIENALNGENYEM